MLAVAVIGAFPSPPAGRACRSGRWGLLGLAGFLIFDLMISGFAVGWQTLR